MSKWLFLRGSWDCRTLRSLVDNDDMWIQLFKSIAGIDNYDIYFDGINGCIDYDCDYVFSRGGFEWQNEIVGDCKKAKKIYYGAGRRYEPTKNVWDTIFVDTEDQLEKVSAKMSAKVYLLNKPAAEHFKPIEVPKYFDICFIANGQQADIKGIKWFYDGIKNQAFSCLHLGYDSRYSPPSNVTRKRVDRIKMPEYISSCKVGVVPYSSVDSSPRVIPEMLACGIPVLILDSVNASRDIYPVYVSNKENFWCELHKILDNINLLDRPIIMSDNFKQNLNVYNCGKEIRSQICVG